MKTKLHQTKNSLGEKIRVAMVALLNAQLADALAAFGASARAAIDTVAKAGDADTADLFTEVSRGVDKLLWMVEAHAQAKD